MYKSLDKDCLVLHPSFPFFFFSSFFLTPLQLPETPAASFVALLSSLTFCLSRAPYPISLDAFISKSVFAGSSLSSISLFVIETLMRSTLFSLFSQSPPLSWSGCRLPASRFQRNTNALKRCSKHQVKS